MNLRDQIEDLKYLVSKDNSDAQLRNFYRVFVFGGLLAILVFFVLFILAMVGVTAGGAKLFSLIAFPVCLILWIVVFILLARD